MNERCTEHESCEFFTSVHSSPILRVKYATMYPYCNSGKHESCMRWWLIREGKDVPADLLPDGSRDIFAEEAHRPVRPSACRVLVVDDMSVFRKTLTGFVETACQAPVEIIEANSAEHAIELLDESGEWTAVVTDYNMGAMTGLDLIRAMRASATHAQVPAIVFSSESDTAMQERCVAMPRVRWLQKRPERQPFVDAWSELVVDRKL